MRQKKLIAVIMVMTMAFSMAACGADKGSLNTDHTGNAQNQEAEGTVGAKDAEVEQKNAIKQNSETEDAAGKFTATIEETVLVDENGVKITATELTYTNYSAELNVLVENNSSGDISVTSNTLRDSCNAINGYMMNDGYMHESLPAGKKANATLDFSLNALTLYGIEEIADIQVGFYIEGDGFDEFYSGPIQIKTSAADTYDYSQDTYHSSINSGLLEKAYGCTVDYYAEEELYNQADVRMISEALITNKNGEKVLLLEVQNDSQEMVCGVVGSVSINGLVVCGGFWSSDSINPGARCIIDLSMESLLNEAYREAFGISDIENVTCSFAVEDSDDEKIGESQEIHVIIAGEGRAFNDSGDELYNENGIRIVSKGIVQDERLKNMDILLMMENNYSDTIRISDVFNSLSVNGFMIDGIMDNLRIAAGESAMMDVYIYSSSLEDNNIHSVEDITDMEISFEVEDDNYNTIAEFKVSATY